MSPHFKSFSLWLWQYRSFRVTALENIFIHLIMGIRFVIHWGSLLTHDLILFQLKKANINWFCWSKLCCTRSCMLNHAVYNRGVYLKLYLTGYSMFPRDFFHYCGCRVWCVYQHCESHAGIGQKQVPHNRFFFLLFFFFRNANKSMSLWNSTNQLVSSSFLQVVWLV